MILPKPLAENDLIGFFSPSAPATCFAPNRFVRAKQFLQKQKYRLLAGQLTGASDYYRSGSIQARAEELNQLIRDPDVRCIMSTIGGTNSNSLLPYIDYQALRRDPKIIIGYSDVTAILLAIYQQIGLVTFYGPALVASFGEYPPLVEQTFYYFQQMVCVKPQLPFTLTPPACWTDEWLDWESQHRAKQLYSNQWIFHGQGIVSGRLIGGNLNTFYGIWGSDYMPEIQTGDILLIEDSLKTIDEVERAFSHLLLCGVFDRVVAILLGKHEKFQDKGTGRTPLSLLLEVLKGQSLPIVAEFDCCHTHPMLTLPIGTILEIDFNQQSIRLPQYWLDY